MSSLEADSTSLKLVLSREGLVWYGEGCVPPVDSGVSYAQFTRLSVFRKARKIRVVGNAENADLILDLWRRRVRGDLTSVQICSPAIVSAESLYSDPLTVLYAMRGYGSVPSLGGWREVDQVDLTTYRMVACKNGFDQQLLHHHPVYPAISFVTNLDESALVEVIRHVIDPRWLVDASRPDSHEPFVRALGITYDNCLRIFQTQPAVSPSQLICERVVDCWMAGRRKPDEPGSFAVRFGNSHRDPVRSMLISSITFSLFLRMVWLDCLSSSHKGRLFVPEYSFSLPAEAAAFRDHIERRARV